MIVENQLGVRNAVIRKLEHELGIPLDTFKPTEFTYLTRLHYKANSDPVWGEHEIDYLFFVKKDVEVKPNPNEVRDYKYVSKEDLKEFLNTEGLKITPWFKIVVERFIYKWWDSLEDLSQFIDTQTIHRM